MSAEEDVALVRRMYEAFLAEDWDAALAFYHPDVELDYSARGDVGVRRGQGALVEIVTAWLGTWEDYSERIDDIRPLAGRVCLISSQSGRGKGSGIVIDHQFAQVYEVCDGLITSVEMFMSRADALEAAGVIE